MTGISPGTTYTLDFQAKPGLSLGTESATASIAATGVTASAPDPASTAITEPGEPVNGDPGSAQAIQSDTLYLGYTSSGSDKDFFQITGRSGRAADDPPQPPAGGRRSRGLRADDRPAADTAPRGLAARLR